MAKTHPSKTVFQHTANAYKEAQRIIRANYKAGLFGYAHPLKPMEIVGDDVQKLHKYYQFQFAQVDGTLIQKFELFLEARRRAGNENIVETYGYPDDLAGSIGTFNFYAALGFVTINMKNSYPFKSTFEINGVWVYVKDGYTFTDEEGEPSQYLGHWNKKGVIVIPYAAAAAISSRFPYLDIPVALSSPATESNVYYPIHNKSFRQWALKHRQGDDFFIYTDPVYVPIFPPIVIPAP